MKARANDTVAEIQTQKCEVKISVPCRYKLCKCVYIPVLKKNKKNMKAKCEWRRRKNQIQTRKGQGWVACRFKFRKYVYIPVLKKLSNVLSKFVFVLFYRQQKAKRNKKHEGKCGWRSCEISHSSLQGQRFGSLPLKIPHVCIEKIVLCF